MNKEEAIKILKNKHIYLDEYEACEDYETENAIKTILDLYQKEIENNKELEIELDKSIELLNVCNKRLENISRYLELNDKNTYGYIYEKIFNKIKELKEKNKELENADLTIVYMNGFYDGEKKWKDKIRQILDDIDNDKPVIGYCKLKKLLEE